MKIVECFSGFGDSIMQRPFIRALSEREDIVYLKTPLPDIYADFPNVRFIKPAADYRTQSKHMTKIVPDLWKPEPARCHPEDRIKMGYSGDHLVNGGSIFNAYESQIPLGKTKFIFDLPSWVNETEVPEIKNNGKPIAVVRPVTIRKEWLASARAPRPEYINQLAYYLKCNGYHVVSMADTEPEVEWIVGAEPPAHQKFHRGELGLRKMLALVKNASVVVTGIGLFVPMGIAAGTPTFAIFGGQGAYNQVSKITDFRMDLSKFGYALPERFCRCTELVHNCPKLIENLPEKFWDFMIRTQKPK